MSFAAQDVTVDVSAAVAVVCGDDLATADRYEARNDALRSIARRRDLARNDVALLMAYVGSTNDVLRAERAAALKNDVLNLLRNQDPAPDGLAELLIGMLEADEISYPPVELDYCIQHLGALLGDVKETDLRDRIRAALVEAAGRKNLPYAGTALYSLAEDTRGGTHCCSFRRFGLPCGMGKQPGRKYPRRKHNGFCFAGCVTRITREGKPPLDLTWNGQYQFVSVSTNGVFAESYAYDALGRRVSTTTLEGTVRHVYDDSWQCLVDIDEGGSVLRSYVWGEGIANKLDSGEDFGKLRDTYVIFITENDVMGDGLEVYVYDRTERKSGKRLGDGTYIIYVNGATRSETEIGKLVHDLLCRDAAKMYFDVFKKRVNEFKKSEEGRRAMCKAVEEYAERRAAESKAEGERKGKRETMLAMAKRMLKDGILALKDIARYSGLLLAQVKKLQAEMA